MLNVRHDKQQKPDISLASLAPQGQSSKLGKRLSGKQPDLFMTVFKMFLHYISQKQKLA